MKMLLRVVLLASLASTTVVAHHGNAAFDVGKTLDLKGTVTEWIWANPHCFLKFDTKEANGVVRNWTVETSNPPDMVNRGWSRRSFKAGDQVKVTVEPVKSGYPVGRLLQAVFPDGRTLSTRGPVTQGGSEPAPPQ